LNEESVEEKERQDGVHVSIFSDRFSSSRVNRDIV